MATDDTGKRAATAAEWDEFCDRLKEAGKLLLRPETPARDIDRAEGLRYLARLTRLGLDLCFEHADADFPAFLNAWNPTTKAGSDNPDNLYLNATVTGDREYRLRGHRGTAPRLRFSTFAYRRENERPMVQTGSLRAADMTFAPDGTFEVTVSTDPRPGNWLPLAADSSLLTVRQNFGDRNRETRATVSIERIGGPATPRRLSTKHARSALQGATSVVSRISGRYAEWAQWFQKRPNRLHPQDATPFHEEGGDPNTSYLHGYWSLSPTEALVIETQVPTCDVWNFQLSNYWMESLDYRYYPVCVNKHGASYNPDGSLTLIVGAQKPVDTRKFPSAANFLSTTGHRSGMMIFRWTRAESYPVPSCRVVELSSLSTDS